MITVYSLLFLGFLGTYAKLNDGPFLTNELHDHVL